MVLLYAFPLKSLPSSNDSYSNSYLFFYPTTSPTLFLYYLSLLPLASFITPCSFLTQFLPPITRLPLLLASSSLYSTYLHSPFPAFHTPFSVPPVAFFATPYIHSLFPFSLHFLTIFYLSFSLVFFGTSSLHAIHAFPA